MPNTGRPSRGCHACRARKVKCDQITPACGRCTRSGRACPGYRTEADLNFRDMSLHAEVRVQSRVREQRRRREGKSASRSPVGDISDVEAGAGPSTTTGTRPLTFRTHASMWPLVSSISIDWEAEATQVFFSDYVINSSGPGLVGGYLEFLPDLYRESPECLCLNNALTAASFAHIASQTSLSWFSIRSRQSYGKALSLLNNVLQDPDQAQQDSTLATVVLLSLYEIISGDKPETIAWDSHESGRALLLRLRGLEQFQSPRGQSLFRVVNSHMQWTYLFRAQQPPDETTIWIEALGRSLPSKFTQLLLLIHKTSQIRASARGLMSDVLPTNQDVVRRSLGNLLQEAATLDLEYQQWSDSASEVYQYRKIETSDSSDQDSSLPYTARPRDVFVYHDIWVATQWHKYYIARIYLLQTMIECQFHLISIPTLGKEPVSDKISSSDDLNHIIIEMVNGICASIPFMMGEVDSNGSLRLKPSGRVAYGGIALLLPLHVAARVKVIGLEQRMWIRGRLRHIGCVTGISQANFLAAQE